MSSSYIKPVIHTTPPRSSNSSSSGYYSDASYDRPYYESSRSDYSSAGSRYPTAYHTMPKSNPYPSKSAPRSGTEAYLVRTPEPRGSNPDGYYAIKSRDQYGREIVVHNTGQRNNQSHYEPRNTKDNYTDKWR
ncbi:MAG: hypothetical protein M1836_003696 [Candelina mexicana]|nr:MAG: hypothetical protein M1836_003696 [Candelina mexicana]